ncbi:hypothetical protein [Actinoplanes utahensis]|uniref:Uncharacterized protein n=1 Tax=Actinoplanes utahensis TaxID=1869 RepID=A0A0A6UIB6_ACTUT|nr:hypothetical protein [Actinoplanes utahensis]KHD75815.1 hypothetical protein MB27_20450 [Actinoplanes utahensis]GIF32212.1 hypothetical protein Aut01nite_51980 [Actinoplanes utahensis]
MRSQRIVLVAAALFAVTHAVGVLLAAPVWRFAELLSLASLILYAVVSGLPAPRWALPAALAVLLVDAVRTLSGTPGDADYDWQVRTPADGIDTTSGFGSALAAWWAPLVAVVLLLTVRARGRRPSPVVTAVAATAAVLITGYAVVRVIGVGLLAPQADAVIAVSLAVLPAVVLGLAAVTLAAALAGRGHRLAAAGASLLAVVALPTIDAGVAATPLPYAASNDPGLFGWDLIMPTMAMPQPVPALTTVLEMAAFLLLVAGLTGSRAVRPQ